MGRLAIVLVILWLQACTSQGLYNAAQAARQNECVKLADSEARAGCEARANLRYDQYTGDRLEKAKD
ncbi:hypothetical protein JCM14076_18400 [Methylosoma difficile]